MEKVQLVVLGLSASPASNNAYALILKEIDGNRRLPIIIGAFEAQAIALEMEGVLPPRPMTHDLIKSVIDTLGGVLSEVVINELRDGTFYARLIFDSPYSEIDARPSDAIAIAVRATVPIYVHSDILDETGLIPQEEENDYSNENDENINIFRNKKGKEEGQAPKSRADYLQGLLDKAIKDEDYEKAADLRDQLRRILDN
jgi:uncharacterized protein